MKLVAENWNKLYRSRLAGVQSLYLHLGVLLIFLNEDFHFFYTMKERSKLKARVLLSVRPTIYLN